MIPFNKPFFIGRELAYIAEAVSTGKLSGNGPFTQRCHRWFEQRYGIHKALLTTSCTDALEMAALLADIKPGDEVIVPSYTFVSTANAFVLRGARLVFADSLTEHPNMDPQPLAALITPKTRAIVVVHYAGVAVDMDPVLALAAKHHLVVIEDAAQGIEARYKGRPLGAIGHLGAFSFHETKNIIAGEGGLLAVNEPSLAHRAEIIWEKGTNRASFFRGEVDKYGWVDVGSSFLPSELVAAYLWAQLENAHTIQQHRHQLWQRYWNGLARGEAAGAFRRPVVPAFAEHNAHMFYLVCDSLDARTQLIAAMRAAGFHLVFHYLSLHQSAFYADKHDGRALPNSDYFSDRLVRLPLFYELSLDDVDRMCAAILGHFGVK